jgi:exodeoxyribonuclease V gamma subunit
VENSVEVLGELLEKYWLGLTTPLHFFPESCWEFMRMLAVNNGSEEEAVRSARKTWKGSDFSRGESEDLYHQLCFRRADPLDEEFQELASEILGPLLEHLRDIGT